MELDFQSKRVYVAVQLFSKGIVKMKSELED